MRLTPFSPFFVQSEGLSSPSSHTAWIYVTTKSAESPKLVLGFNSKGGEERYSDHDFL
jgi:hypothetical protein